MRTRGTATLVAFALVIGGCSDDGGAADGRDDAAPTTEDTTSPPGEVLDGTGVLDAVGPSVALVETPLGSGSAVLLEDGHVVTNAHVVDPFGEADVTLAGAEPEHLAVVGIDLAADIAVLEPLDDAGPGVAMEDTVDIPVGADLYLVGFPGDTAEPEVTISRGVLSRRRTAEGWGLDLLQTDAAISDGQSGGAVVDGTGRVVGISGLSYDEQFALALTGEDVRASVEAILAGEGSEWSPLPADDAATETEVAVGLDGGLGLDTLYLPAGAPGEVTVTADADAVLQVTDLALYPLAVNQAAADGGAVEPSGDPDFDADLPEPTDAASPGTWTFSVPAEEPLLVFVDSDDVDASSVAVEVSEAFAVVSPNDDPADVAVGDEVEGVVTALGEADTFFLDLAAGESVTVTVTSAVGDMAFTTYALDDPEDPGTETDDGGGGLLELDATSTLTADGAGTYAIDVYQVDGYANAYRLTVEPA